MKKLIEHMYSKKYPVSLGAGGCRSQRFELLIPQILQEIEGDILEISACTGKSTLIFLKYAKRYDQKVYVIDPRDGSQEGNEQIYQRSEINPE